MNYSVYDLDGLALYYSNTLTSFADSYIERAVNMNQICSSNSLILKSSFRDRFKEAEERFFKYELDAATMSHSQHKSLSKTADELKEKEFKAMCEILRKAFISEITKGSGSVRLFEYEYRIGE